MKKNLFFLLIFGSLISKAQNDLNIVPMPAEIKMGNGAFNVNWKTVIVLEGRNLERTATLFKDYIQKRQLILLFSLNIFIHSLCLICDKSYRTKPANSLSIFINEN